MLIAGREAACGYPAVVAKLKLTPNQLRQLKEGVAASLVLTESQSKGLDEFLGEKFDFQSVLSVVDPVSESVGDIRKQIENPPPESPKPLLACSLPAPIALDFPRNNSRNFVNSQKRNQNSSTSFSVN